MLVTASEDATCKVWPSILPHQSESQTISKPIETMKGHSGKNIRALATHQGLIATGGDDGSIKVWNAPGIMA